MDKNGGKSCPMWGKDAIHIALIPDPGKTVVMNGKIVSDSPATVLKQRDLDVTLTITLMMNDPLDPPCHPLADPLHENLLPARVVM